MSVTPSKGGTLGGWGWDDRMAFGETKKPLAVAKGFVCSVGMTGFEPATSSSRTKRATGLRYIPKIGRANVAKTRDSAKRMGFRYSSRK